VSYHAVGRVQSISPTSLLLDDRVNPTDQEFAFASIQKIETSAGKRSSVSEGMGAGVLIGCLGGGVIGWTIGDSDCGPGEHCLSKGEAAALGAITGAPYRSSKSHRSMGGIRTESNSFRGNRPFRAEHFTNVELLTSRWMNAQ
jgi:hypothetical protein